MNATPPQVEAIIKRAVQFTIGDAAFEPQRLQGWTDGILKETLKNLAHLARPFKFVVTVSSVDMVVATRMIALEVILRQQFATNSQPHQHAQHLCVQYRQLAVVAAYWSRVHLYIYYSCTLYDSRANDRTSVSLLPKSFPVIEMISLFGALDRALLRLWTCQILA